mgnify:CR=1 FL=1
MSNGGSKQVAVSVFRSMNKCTCYLLPRGSIPGTPPRNPREPRRNGTVWVFPCTTGTYPRVCSNFAQRYIAQDQSFFGPFYFISAPKFDTMSHVSILPGREGLFVINFLPFTQRLLMVFVCHKKQVPSGIPGLTHGEANHKFKTFTLRV